MELIDNFAFDMFMGPHMKPDDDETCVTSAEDDAREIRIAADNVIDDPALTRPGNGPGATRPGDAPAETQDLAANDVPMKRDFSDAEIQMDTAEKVPAQMKSQITDEQPTREMMLQVNDYIKHVQITTTVIADANHHEHHSLTQPSKSQENAVATESATCTVTRKRKHKTFSDIRLMFEKRSKSCEDDQTLDCKSNKTKHKRLRTKSLPVHEGEFIANKSPSDVNRPRSSPKYSMDRLTQLMGVVKPGREAGNHNISSEELPIYHGSEAFYNILRFFQERAHARIEPTNPVTYIVKQRHSCPSESSDQSEVRPRLSEGDSIKNMNASLADKTSSDRSGMDSQLFFHSVEEFHEIIKTLLSHQSDDPTNQKLDDEVISKYHKSQAFYDTLMFFEAKAQAGNQSAMEIVSALKKYSNLNNKNRRKSLPMASTNGKHPVSAGNDADVASTQLHVTDYRRRSTPMDFAPIDQQEYMDLKDDSSNQSNPADNTIGHLQLTPTEPIPFSQTGHCNDGLMSDEQDKVGDDLLDKSGALKKYGDVFYDFIGNALDKNDDDFADLMSDALNNHNSSMVRHGFKSDGLDFNKSGDVFQDLMSDALDGNGNDFHDSKSGTLGSKKSGNAWNNLTSYDLDLNQSGDILHDPDLNKGGVVLRISLSGTLDGNGIDIHDLKRVVLDNRKGDNACQEHDLRSNIGNGDVLHDAVCHKLDNSNGNVPEGRNSRISPDGFPAELAIATNTHNSENSCDALSTFKDTLHVGGTGNASSHNEINPRDLFKAAIVVADKQHIDINLIPSSIVDNLAHLASFMRFRMTSGTIPFDSMGAAIMNLIGPYRYKPLARVLLEDLTPSDEDQLVKNLAAAVKDFPGREVRKLADGDISSGTLYLAVSKVVNDFVSEFTSDKIKLLAAGGSACHSSA